MRVVQVSFHADRDRREPEALLAAWPTLSGVAAGASRAGVEVIVVQAAHKRQSLERDGVTYHFVADDRTTTSRVPWSTIIRRRSSQFLERVLSLRPDVVHVHGLAYHVAVRQLGKALNGTPLLVQDHGSVAPHGWRTRAWRWAYRDVDGLAFTSRQQASPFFEARVFPAGLPVFEVLGGSSSFTAGDRHAARARTGMSGDPCFIWSSHLAAGKDPFTMLEAFELAAPRLPDARLWCCFGSAPLLDAVRDRIRSSAVLSERVTLVGQRPHAEMELRFRAADFFIQTSHREASGFSLLEALACGATPIVTDIPASRVIVDGAGSLTPVGDANAMANAIVEWSRRDRASLRRAARARFDKALSYDVIGRQLHTAYTTLASRR